ncbi:MAG: cyclic nucleotide-binding protein [Acidimicrobiales bacterium]|nr:cyclic nucleotide-binding protein [Acidimicrobiales bacterium]
MSRRDLVERLRSVPLFALCTHHELQQLARGAEVVDVDADVNLVLQGDHGTGVFVILSGGAKVVRNRRTIAMLGAGSQFGELALLDPGPRTATVRTTEPSRVAIIDAKAFRTVLHESPAMAERLLAALARRARDAGMGDTGA